MTHVTGTRMAAEMGEQPAVLRRLVRRRLQLGPQLRTISQRLRGVVLVARGSSDNAAVYGRYVLEHALKVPVALAAPSLQTRYGVTPRLEGFLVIAVSQSGATPEIVDTMRRLASGGGRTLAITNVAGSPLDDAADETILLEAGEEHAVPATKTFTAQVAAFALIAEALAEAVPWQPQEWDNALGAVERVVATAGAVDELAAKLADAGHVVPLGRGFLYAVALEAGLKIAETTGLTVHAYSPADLRHGPIASTSPGTQAACFVNPGPTAADVATTATQLADRGAHVAAVTPDADLVPCATTTVAVPAGVAEPLAALPHVVRAQQLALATARLRGVDPDAPFSLEKITPTR